MMSDRRACLTNPRVLLTMSLIFLAGAVAGGLAMRYGLHGMMHAQAPFWQEGGKQVSLQHLTSELESDAQATGGTGDCPGRLRDVRADAPGPDGRCAGQR